MSLHRTEAIVIRVVDFLEYDKLVTLYTQKLGKVRAVVKSARKPTSKLAPSLSLFAHLKITLFGKRPKELYRLTQTEIVSFHQRLREEVERLTYSALFIELLNRATGENEPDAELFELCVNYLNGIEKKVDLHSYTLIHLIKLLQIVGFAPWLTGCLVCRTTVSDKKTEQNWMYSVNRGGLVCSACRKKKGGKNDGTSLQPISRGAIYFYQQVLRFGFPRVIQLKIDRKQGRPLFDLLLNHIAYHLEGQLKSQKFYRYLTGTKGSDT
ncbi:MAG: DNA repair protein RecO [bacterium]|nr:DNA repair protein RecO [bacterium]